ncbi:MAG: SCO family protein, partial [Rhodocyclaceae bacterium]|nr:SCO family protein [Rhodocyclaceae bacterium]
MFFKFRLTAPIFLALVLGAATGAQASSADEAMAVVTELGRINGQALACRQTQVAARTKALMLAHVPKLRHWGEAYEQATSAAFITPAGGCPEGATLRVQAEVLASRLAALLPASAPPPEIAGPDIGIMPRFLLQAPGGRSVMDSDFRGRFQLIAFGYTYCPDICPTTLVEMSHVLRLLGASAKHVQMIFISVDPDRDTPEALKIYTEFFDPRILGLTGSKEMVRKVADLFKVRYEKVQEPGASHYAMDHSAGMVLIGPDGVF